MKKEERRDRTITMKVTEKERDLIKSRALKSGYMNQSEFIRKIIFESK